MTGFVLRDRHVQMKLIVLCVQAIFFPCIIHQNGEGTEYC